MKKTGSGSKIPTFFELNGQVKGIERVVKLNTNTAGRLLDRINELEHVAKVNADTVGRIIDRVIELENTVSTLLINIPKQEKKLVDWTDKVLYAVCGAVAMGILALLFQIT